MRRGRDLERALGTGLGSLDREPSSLGARGRLRPCTMLAVMAENDEIDDDEGGGMKSFLILVLVIFGLIVAAVAALGIFGPDSGLLPFDYEGA